MKPLNFKYQYFALFFIFLFISIGSVVAVDDSTFVDSSNDLSSQIEVSDDFENVTLKDDKSIVSLGASKTTKTLISAKSLAMNYGANSSIVGYLKTSSGKAIKSKVVKITINGQTWSKSTDSNGKISLKIPILDPNIYSLKFSFTGDSSYSASSCLVNITVKKLSTKLTSNDLYYYDNNKLVAYLKDSNNNPLKNKLVKFTIDNNSFNAFSDSNGQITFDIPPSLKSENYSANINFVGDKYYSSSSTSVNVYKFDNTNIESFISELINSKEFEEFLNINSKELNQSFQINQSSQLAIDNDKNQSSQNASELAFTQLLDNLTDDELEYINQFLNLISADSNLLSAENNLVISDSNLLSLENKLDINSNQNTALTNILENIWTWLNTPILEIPGYADLDKKYGVFGQGLKLAGWFLLGIDDNGGLSPLDIGLDALSLISGAGLAERIGISSSSLVLKLATKFPRFDSLLKASINLKGLEYSITIKTLFSAYKSSLSILNNPVKFVSNKIITNVLDKWDSKIASFTMNYISNSFLTVSSVLGISEVYVNAKENTLFTSKILLNIDNSNTIEFIINESTSPIASTLKNIKTTADSISNTIKDISKEINNTIILIGDTLLSAVNAVTTTSPPPVKNLTSTATTAVKKVTTTVKNTIKKAATKITTSAKKVSTKVKKTVKKAVKKVSKVVKKTVKKVAKKVSTKVKSVKKTVKKTVKKVVSTVKKAVKSASTIIKKLKLK